MKIRGSINQQRTGSCLKSEQVLGGIRRFLIEIAPECSFPGCFGKQVPASGQISHIHTSLREKLIRETDVFKRVSFSAEALDNFMLFQIGLIPSKEKKLRSRSHNQIIQSLKANITVHISCNVTQTFRCKIVCLP